MPAARRTGPRDHLSRDPRFPALLAKALRRHGMEEWFADSVTRLVTGETDPRSVQCCNSGCHPCAKDYLGAAEDVIAGLAPKKRKRFFFF